MLAKKIMISTLFAVLSGSVFAVGLGSINNTSGLNQPLKAEIPLLSSGDLAEYEVIASLASNSEFEKIGIEKVFFLNSLKFKTVRDDNNQIVIHVTSRKAVKEPFLNFVVELNWPNGRILREYTLLLDPPVFEKKTSSTINQSTTQSTSSSVTTSQYQQAPQNAAYDGGNDTYQQESYLSSSQYGPVKNTDTLWSIASKVRPSRSVSIHQTLVAIYRANPDAFFKGNINNLLKGKILEIPTESTIQGVPQRAALQDVVMQNRQWRSGGARKIVDRTAKKTSHKIQSGGSRLSLSTADQSGEADGYGSDASELNNVKNELIRTQEESATLQAENEALRSRLAEILKKAEKVNKSVGINVEDTEMAALAQGLGKQDPDSDDSYADDDATDSATEQDSSIEEISQDENLADDENVFADDAENLVVDDDETTITTDQTDTKEIAEVKKESTAPSLFKSKKEKGFFDEILNSGALLWASIAGIIAILLMVVFWRMKKRMEDDEFQDELVASAGAGSMDTTETFELPDVGDDMLVELDMDEDSEDANNSDESFDPLGEADIYIAYGKHDQAENILLDAIEENPVRADLKVKLMECYAQSDSKEKFEALEAEVLESIDADEWLEQIKELKANTWADSEIESDDLPSTEDIFGETDDELDIDFDDVDSSETEDDALELDTLDEIESSLDDSAEPSENSDDLSGLDELDNIEEDFSIDDDISDTDEISEVDDVLELDTIDADDTNTDTLDDSDESSLDIDNDFSFDEEDDGEFDENFADDSDEIATKLDLARAYVDMGDSEGAKEILQEVVAEGNDEQKQEAQSLIDKAD